MGVEMREEMPFSVDTWTPYSARKKYHFLTHAHKDHTAGLPSCASYPIYCTAITKQIILLRYPTIEEGTFVELEVGEPVLVGDLEQPFTVTAFDANHCAGAIMLYFEGQFGNILHTGDCRLSADCLSKLPRKLTMKSDKASRDCLDCLYLDCTFGKESYKMPSKYSAVKQVIICIWKHPGANTVYLACDLLGQEDILVEISKTFGSKIYVDKSLLSEYHAIVSVVVPELLSEDPSCRFQVCEGFPRLYERAKAKFAEAEKMGQPKPLFIRPSAQWYTCEERQGIGSVLNPLSVLPRRGTQSVPKEAERDQFGVWHVCYSMHSSKEELEEALKVLNPKEVISTTPNCRATELQHVKEKFSNAQTWCENISGLEFRAAKSFHHSGSMSAINHDFVTEATTCHVLTDTSHVTRQMSSVTKNEKLSDFSVALEQERSDTHTQLSSPSKPIPLFGMSRYNLPPSPPMSFSDGEDDCRSSKYGVPCQQPSSHPSQSIQHEILVGKVPSQFTGLTWATEIEEEGRSCTTSTKHNEECGRHPSVSRPLPMEGKRKKPHLLSNQLERKERNMESSNSQNDDLGENDKASCMQSTLIEDSSLSFDGRNPRTLHESVRKMYRSLHVPVPQPLPSLLDLVNHIKRPKLRSSQS